MATKNPGRRKKGPRQPSLRRGRYQINVLLGAETKDYLLAAARKSGRTTSAEAAVLVENAITMNRLLAAMATTIEQVAAGNLEVALRKAGYVPLRDPRGTVWLPPDHPSNPGRSSFEAWAPGELEAQATGISDEEIERRNRAKIEANARLPLFDMDAARRQLGEIEEISNAPKEDDAA
jgi:hypothetical protein